LNEGAHGSVSSRVAAMQLIRFILDNRAGFSLVVMVRNKSAISMADQDNYHLFYEVMCESKIPLVLAITHCDFDEPVSRWWDTNQRNIVGKNATAKEYGWRVDAAVCVCSIDNDSLAHCHPAVRELYAKRREQSKKDMYDAMSRLVLSQSSPIVIASWWQPFVRVWNWIAALFRQSQWVIKTDTTSVIPEAARRALTALQLTNEEINSLLLPE